MSWISKIPFSEFEFEFVRSGGPGGQHVNRTNTAAILRWNPMNSAAFSNEQKQIIIKKLTAKLTQAGELIIRSQEFRDQDRNKKRCLEKLNQIIERALHVAKKRKATRPTKASREKRLKSKKIKSEIKKLRSQKIW